MRIYTNMAWPDDPYRTGQQLYRRPVPRLAAFATGQTAAAVRPTPAAVAIVYLPLHRTLTVTVTEQTLTFGFRVASAEDSADMPRLALIADLDLMQARRHAAVLAGHLLARELAVLRQADDAGTLRGLAAVEREWAARGPAAGKAATFDCALELPGRPSLEHACQEAGITASPGGSEHGTGRPVGCQAAVERALMIALVCARHQGRYDWAGTLRTEQVMAAMAWDCLGADSVATLVSEVLPGHAHAEPAIACGNLK